MVPSRTLRSSLKGPTSRKWRALDAEKARWAKLADKRAGFKRTAQRTSWAAARGVRTTSTGFTLIELMVVIVLIAIISGFTITRISSIALWQHESDLRRFTGLWQALQSEAFNRREAYRLVLSIDSNTYTVRREVPLEQGEIKQVDYLQNLRTKGEQERRKRQLEDQALGSVDEEFQRDDLRQSGSLVPLYYASVFQDPQADVRLTVPLQSPQLGEERQLAQGLLIRDVEYAEERIAEGSFYIRLAPGKQVVPMVVHFQSGEDVYSVFADPVHGRVRTEVGDLRFRDVFNVQR